MKPAPALCLALVLVAIPGIRVCGQSAGGSTPRDHQVHSATSRDGLMWTRDAGVRLTSASVPCAINDRDQRVLLYVVRPPDDAGGVGGVACASSPDGTSFSPEPGFRIEGLSTLSAADPSIVKDAAGGYRLYYLASNSRGDPASEPNPHRINLALSDDGIRFREAGTVFTYDDLVDPDVFEYQGRWFMYVFGRGGTVVATSPDGKAFAYSRVMSPPNWGTTAPVLLPDGRLRLYAFEQRVPLGNAVGSFLSTDGLNWVAEPGERLRAGANEQITDPFVIPWRGGWKMYFKVGPAASTNAATRLTNLSVRAGAGTGGGVLIAGFTVAGAGPKPVLLRGIGPALSLPPFGLAGTLVDPGLEVYAGQNRIAANDNWSAAAPEAAAIAAAAARVGAFPLTPGSRDAAVNATLPTGGYTVQLAGASNATGTALVEVYDADGAGGASPSRLSNLSARTPVGVGAGVLIAGFTIAGSGNQRVLIRAVGPSLGRFNVTGLLADPRIEVFHGAALVAANDNWGAQVGGLAPATVEAAGAGVGAFPLDANSRDAALVLSLPPGGFTAQVSGVNGTTGVALIEVYELAPGTPVSPGGTGGGEGGVQVRAVASTYRAAAGGLTGWIASGQSADLMLSGFGFGESGGSLQFNHPRGLASDGTRLYVSDGHNNRVLVWRRAPEGNTPPDFVLGQAAFSANVPGAALHELNWPGQVSVTASGRVVVADTYNDRLLVWREAPERSGQPADYEIRHAALRWPWGVWTDGTRLVASSTGGRGILVWSSFPATGGTPPDFTLADPAIGTPRTITSDGSFLLVGDHNANGSEAGNWVWRAFPADTRRPDFFLREPSDSNGPWMQGAVDAGGRLVVLGRYLNIWNEVPAGATTPPALIVDGYNYRGGDGSGVAFALGRTYVVAYNDNRVTGYRTLPASRTARPDFAVGSPGLDVNTLTTSYFITNPVPATDGARLYVSSDFDRTLSVWNRIPDESAARPDWLYTLPFAPWDNALSGDTLVLAGQRQVMGWARAPRAGELPDIHYRDRIGSTAFQEIRGVALDAANFYVADFAAGKVHVWRGLPAANAEAYATLDVPGVTRLSSDGTWLVATQTERQSVTVFEVAKLGTPAATGASIGGVGRFNLPQGACVSRGQLYIANTNFNQVHAWRRVEDAIAGRSPDAILGDANPAAAPRATERELFWPGVPAFDGSYLWVGEFKFSGRLLRYSVK